FGPDPDVLLHDDFRGTHCFDVAEPDGDHKGQVGITFRPALGRERIVDISGTLWLDRSPLALSALDFRFEGVDDRSRKAAAGGALSFHTVDNGIVIVDAWSVRIAPPESRQLLGMTRTAGNGVVVTTGSGISPMQIDGGELVSGRWPDGSTVRRSSFA